MEYGPGMLAHAFTPSIWEVEIEGSIFEASLGKKVNETPSKSISQVE
jgi:hypothetical protein